MSYNFLSKNDEKITIRKLESRDAKKVLEYLCLVGSETDYLLMDGQGLKIEIDEEERILERYQHHENSLLLGCFIGEELIAVSNLSVKDRQKIKHISTVGISVKKKYWHQGIGRNMMEFMIDFAQKSEQIEVIQLEVRSDNIRAVKLYKSLGFHNIGVIPKAMKIGEKYYENIMMVLDV